MGIYKMSRLYVGNVSNKGNIQELKNLLSETGKIKFFGVNNESGYMEYETTEEAEESIKKFNGYNFGGKDLVIEPARKGGFRGGRGDQAQRGGRRPDFGGRGNYNRRSSSK